MSDFKLIITILVVVALAEAFGVMAAVRNLFAGLAPGK